MRLEFIRLEEGFRFAWRASPMSCAGRGTRRKAAACYKVSLCVGLVFVLSVSISCLPSPTRTSAQHHSRWGGVDLSFLEVGKTTREEILEELDWAETRMDRENVFWARWRVTNLIYYGGGEYWRSRNLLVEFDGAGVVKRFDVVKEHALPEFILKYAAVPKDGAFPGLPLHIPVSHRHFWRLREAVLMVTQEGITFSEAENKSHDFSLSVNQIERLKTKGPQPGDKTSDRLKHTLYFYSKTPAGRKLTFWTAAPDSVALILYLDWKDIRVH